MGQLHTHLAYSCHLHLVTLHRKDCLTVCSQIINNLRSLTGVSLDVVTRRVLFPHRFPTDSSQCYCDPLLESPECYFSRRQGSWISYFFTNYSLFFCTVCVNKLLCFFYLNADFICMTFTLIYFFVPVSLCFFGSSDCTSH